MSTEKKGAVLPEREKPGLQPLNETQKEIAGKILETIASKDKQLIIIEGLSGVGKTAVLDSVRTGILAKKGLIAQITPYLSFNELEPLVNCEGPLIVPLTYPSEYYEGKLGEYFLQNFPDRKISKFILKGMSIEETNEFLDRYSYSHGNSLTKEMIVHYSLGIPLLVKELTLPGLDSESAVLIPAGYLKRNILLDQSTDSEKLNEMLSFYLQMPICNEVLKSLEELRASIDLDVYAGLQGILERREVLWSRGIDEESPLFIASESVDVYNAMLKSNQSHRGTLEIEIFVPDIPPAVFQKISRSFGGNLLIGGYEFSQATRFNKMFNISEGYRKTEIWHKPRNGDESFFEDSDYARADKKYLKVPERAKKYQIKYRSGELNIKPLSGGIVDFLVRCRAHNGQTYRPVSIGWATESLLQQLGLPYFVNNKTYGQAYTFDPEQGKLHFQSLLEI